MRKQAALDRAGRPLKRPLRGVYEMMNRVLNDPDLL